MLHNNFRISRHIPDEELIRATDGELSATRAAEVDVHLQACWDCRARMQEIQTTIMNFARAHHGQFDRQLPPVAGPRALLRARLDEMGSTPPVAWWKRHFKIGIHLPRIAIAGLSLLIIAVGTMWLWHDLRSSASVLSDPAAAPNRNLTPGATRQVTISEVCSVPQEEVVGNVSIPLRRKVLQAYGIANARPEDYEIDYLIAPRLGGVEDIRNLWPEPYRTRVWNAHIKDALEERLHEMVCSGQLDLPTAQRDIASDWIAAYKKYFHTNKPLPLSS